MVDFRNNRFFWFIKNMCVFWRCDIYKELEELKCKQRNQQCDIDSFRILKTMLDVRDKILVCANEDESFRDKYKEEISYLAEYNCAPIFPYKQIKKVSNCFVSIDEKYNLPYVLHNNKKLYFPSNFSEDLTKNTYVNFIENECILGGGGRKRAPHQYQSDMVKVEKEDVLIDIGCAEGLFALDVIDKVKKVYLIESDPNWIPVLKATFKPYSSKVIILNKKVSAFDSETTIKLETILRIEKEETPVFVKMDIEGFESSVLEASRDFLKERKNIKMACCTYHRQNDECFMKNFFESLNYEIEFSDGYMLFVFDNLQYPFFRKGVIRAKKY